MTAVPGENGMGDDMARERFLAEQKHKCDRLLKHETRTDANTSDVWCPATFDGLLCWPPTPSSSLAALSCPPPSVLGLYHTKSGMATKLCLANGHWFRNIENIMWSNYTLCTTSKNHYVTAIADLGYLEYGQMSNSSLLNKWLPIIKIVSQVGYASSFATLIIAMVIFSMLRKLRNPRNRLHMHLFASFIMRAFMAFLKDWLFIDGVGLAGDMVLIDGKSAFIKERNTWVCKAITSLWQYFIVANYAWILMEGLYLHNLIFLALCTDTPTITLYIILGWGLPGMVVITWVVIRATVEDTLCWTTHNNPSHFLVIRIPIMVSILFNFLLFVNIVRVLLVKLKTSVHLQRKKMQYRRWAKSTLVLVPLFGAHYTLFLGLSYHTDHHVELIWLFCDQLFASFQGCFVALLYCLLNGEVRAEIRRAWKARRSRRDVDSLILAHRDLSRFSKSRASTSCTARPERTTIPTTTNNNDNIPLSDLPSPREFP